MMKKGDDMKPSYQLDQDPETQDQKQVRETPGKDGWDTDLESGLFKTKNFMKQFWQQPHL